MDLAFRTTLLLPLTLLLSTSCAELVTSDQPAPKPQARAARPARAGARQEAPVSQAPVRSGQGAQVVEGRTYHCTNTFGGQHHELAAGEAAALRRVTALLETGRTTLVLTLPDGTPKAFRFTFRQWREDCFTMSGSARCEVADLTPVNGHPLVLAGRTFNHPVLSVKCFPGRIVLADKQPEAEPSLVLDL